MMDDATQKLVDEAREWAVIMMTPEAQGSLIRRLADALEAAQRPPVSPEVEELLLELRALGADVPERLRQATLLAQAGVPTEALEAFVRGYVSGVPSHPVYDEEAIARALWDAAEVAEDTGRDRHPWENVSKDVADWWRAVAAALVAALPGLTKEEKP